MRAIPEQGYMFSGHVVRASALEQVRRHLIDHGVHDFDADERVMDRPGLVVRAWWGGEGRGFVQEDHDGAQPVIVVNVPPPGGAAEEG